MFLVSDNGMSSLCVQYDQGPSSSKKQTGSLLDALEHNEKKCREEDGLLGEQV